MGGNPNAVSVWVANLGKYNEGSLVGTWITLPIPQAELDRILRDKVGLELDPQTAFEKSMRGERVYEEYAIHDFDFDKGLEAINYKPHEYVNLDDLNILAAAIEGMTDDELEAVAFCADQQSLDDPLGYANLAVQHYEIPYYQYDFTGIEHSAGWSCEEKFARTLLEGSPLMDMLDAEGVEDYFDFEKYGRAKEHYCTLGDSGYLDCTADFPDIDFYDRDELKEITADKLGDPGYFSKTRASKEVTGLEDVAKSSREARIALIYGHTSIGIGERSGIELPSMDADAR